MDYKLSLLVGDGCGIKLVQAAVDILSCIKLKYGHDFKFENCLIGESAIEKTGVALPQDTIDSCKNTDATIIGAIGSNKYIDNFGVDQSRLAIQKLYSNLKLFSTIVPLKDLKLFPSHSPLKDQVIKKNIDILFVIESSNGIFSSDKGYKQNTNQGATAFDTTSISTGQIQNISSFAFDLAKLNNKKLTLVDIADCSISSVLWRQTIKKVSSLYPDVEFDCMLIDDFVPRFFTRPHTFEIVLSKAILGKSILASASSTTAFNTLPKAVLGAKNKGVYGSYDYDTQNNINDPNPIGIIRSVAMMLYYTFGLTVESNAINQSLNQVLKSNKPSALGGGINCEKFVQQVTLKLINF